MDSTPTLKFDDDVDFAFGVSGAPGKSTRIVVKPQGVAVLVESGATCNLDGLNTLRQLTAIGAAIPTQTSRALSVLRNSRCQKKPSVVACLSKFTRKINSAA